MIFKKGFNVMTVKRKKINFFTIINTSDTFVFWGMMIQNNNNNNDDKIPHRYEVFAKGSKFIQKRVLAQCKFISKFSSGARLSVHQENMFKNVGSGEKSIRTTNT